MSLVERQLVDARQRLLDLSMRNRLLNHRPSRTRSVRVVDEIAREVYDLLVLQEKAMRFVARRSGGSDADPEDRSAPSPDDAPSEIWELAAEDGEPAEQHVDRALQTALAPDTLQQRLFRISQQARSVVEEQGYTVLYLALGFLEWYEAPSAAKARCAPLILVPVSLDRVGVRKAFTLRWTGEEVMDNISLRHKLAQQGVSLPPFAMPEEKPGVDAYLAQVARAIGDQPRWRVLGDLWLDFFSFTKFVMYRDLDPAAWPDGSSPAECPLLRDVLDPSAPAPEGAGFSEHDVHTLAADAVYHVVDADPSQIAVIEDAKAGRNLVVEGPPGTGKSQTITNIIAELLGTGKSVLFVSEKMAALQVVQQRLAGVGLGPFCLELHSRFANKREFLQQIQRSAAAEFPLPGDLDEEYAELERLRAQLNGYAAALREPVGTLGISPGRALQQRERARRASVARGGDLVPVALDRVWEWDPHQLATARAAVRDLAGALQGVHPVTTHPWRGATVRPLLPPALQEMATAVRHAAAAHTTLSDACDALCGAAGVVLPDTADAVPAAVAAARVIAAAPDPDPAVTDTASDRTATADRDDLVRQVRAYAGLRQRLGVTFRPAALDADVERMLGEFRPHAASLFRVFSGRYRAVRREIVTLYAGTPPRNALILRQLETLAQARQARAALRGARETGRRCFGSAWRADASEPAALAALADWLRAYAELLEQRRVHADAARVATDRAARDRVPPLADAVDAAREGWAAAWRDLADRLVLNETRAFGAAMTATALVTVGERLAAWDRAMDTLNPWAGFHAAWDRTRETVATPLADALWDHDIEPAALMDTFHAAVADAVLARAFADRPELAEFSADVHEQRVARFRELDQALIRKNRERLAVRLARARPRLAAGASAGSEVGILLGQLNRKRGHMAIRQLMTHTGSLLRRVAPCFMMSPLSVAQFLDPRLGRFDVVVFDEASQVRPQEALGALLRADQAIVIGDTRQLPPTSFFDQLVDDTEDEDDSGLTGVAEMESILHQCRRSFPTKRLRWHYRSQHESLIAVSNQEFYDNDLMFYPSAVADAADLGLHYVHLPDAVYDRGRSAANRDEARAVAAAAVAHVRAFPDRSVGVGTFSLKQQQAVLEEMELQLRRHPDIEPLFASGRPEHFFVKNLETIQGDERDVILLSVGYGFDGAGRFSRNFGPLNKEGGERRLNVLITRARRKCVVYANFGAEHLAVDPDTPWGVRGLKTFLHFAQTRQLTSTEPPGDDADSAFEESVADTLRSHGCEVRHQVGCAGFRVDLAVLDPAAPGRYAIGIECDGAKYHSSPVARDRDRLRQQILERQGWRIHRVWSTDWYRSRAHAETRLLEAVRDAVATPPSAVSVARPAVDPAAPPVPPAPRDSVGAALVDGPVLEVAPYRRCDDLGVRPFGDLHVQPVGSLAEMAARVVAVEWPVHQDEVARRIRTLWGLKRTGRRIREAVALGVDAAVRAGRVVRRGPFLWIPDAGAPPVRRRDDDPPADIDLICDEEIAAAVVQVLAAQFATPPDDLAVQTPRAFGIQATHSDTAGRVLAVVQDLLRRGTLRQRDDGMVEAVQE